MEVIQTPGNPPQALGNRRRPAEPLWDGAVERYRVRLWTPALDQPAYY
jgi:hypothetical protein